MTLRSLVQLASVALTALLLIGFVQRFNQQSASKSIAASPAAARHFQWTLQGQANSSPESNWAAEHRKLGDLVRLATGGEVDISYVSDVVPDTEVLAAVKAGTLNLGFVGVHYQPDMALMNFQLLPIVPNQRLPEMLALLKPRFSQIWEQQWGVKLLAFSYYLPQLLYTNRPADTLASLEGRKIRQFGAHAINVYERAGAVPVRLESVQQVPLQLAEGKLDGAQGALPAYVNWGWAQHLRYISNWPLGSTYMALVVNRDNWNSLTPELQGRLLKAAEAIEMNQWNSRQAHIDALLAESADRYGASVVNPSVDEIEKLLRHAGPALEEWKAQTGPDSARVLAAINQVLGTDYR